MMQVDKKTFERIVRRAIRRIPKEIRRHLDNILITVQKRPSPDMLREMGLPADEPLLGLYSGVSLMDRSVMEPPLFPDTIFIFQRPLEAICETVEELEREIEITVVHEIAHAIGMSEEWIAELGYE